MKIRNVEKKGQASGYALVAALSIMLLVVMLALSMLKLSTGVTNHTGVEYHSEVARANARLALAIALAQLQEEMGPDQRVSAMAEILGVSENPKWLGVWETTLEKGEEKFPVVGKGKPTDSPYRSSRYYTDLREHRRGVWKQKMHRRWLVSGATHKDASKVLNNGVEMVGRGTLGELDDKVEEIGYVKVPKVSVPNGGYAWWVADQNLKASIGAAPFTQQELKGGGSTSKEVKRDHEIWGELAIEANPELIDSDMLGGLEKGFEGYSEISADLVRKSISTSGLALAAPAYRQQLKRGFHDLTHSAEGLQVDVTLGSLKRDLTPLLFGHPGRVSLELKDDTGRVFHSDQPLIPGPDHGVLGPSYGALRNWGLERYVEDAEMAVLPTSASRQRPTEGWPYGIADGRCSTAEHWAAFAPKVQPTMVDARWHFYFSHDGAGQLRTHIVPRVCLWNPYNREIATGEMTVMLPNPFYNGYGNLYFFLEDEAVEKEREKAPDHSILKDWVKQPYRGGLMGGGAQEAYQFKVELQEGAVDDSLFPGSRFLTFTLANSQFGAGECLVFLPDISVPIESQGATNIAEYSVENPSLNRMSASSLAHEAHHFIHEIEGAVFRGHRVKGRPVIPQEELGLIDLSGVFDYEISCLINTRLGSSSSLYKQVDNFACVLKSGSAETSEGVEELATMQIMLDSASGPAASSYYRFQSQSIGYASNASYGEFGNLETFAENPTKGAPNTHGVGMKLLWLDESMAETAGAPYRVGQWDGAHMAMNPCSIANWNMRAQLVMRSPAAQSCEHWAGRSAGAWMTQFNPLAPNDSADQPVYVDGKNKKNPFGVANEFISSPDVVLFDLPHSRYGALSLGDLRHAQLSPYSWTPSYIVGHSLRDLHAPAQATAHQIAAEGTPAPDLVSTEWDYMLGGFSTTGAPLLGHGPRADLLGSDGLLQIGRGSVVKMVGEQTYSSAHEVLAYDIAYEVNQNIWDQYFISALPCDTPSGGFSSSASWNPNIIPNPYSELNSKELSDRLLGEGGLGFGFWRNAEHYSHRSAFNVNSVSVPAWTAFLSSSLSHARVLAGDALSEPAKESNRVSFARHRSTTGLASGAEVSPENAAAWTGARTLSEDETRALAEAIVEQVKARGPFLSLSDFINRRLAPEVSESSRMGVLEQAIHSAGLNSAVSKKYDSTVVDKLAGKSEDNNLAVLRSSYIYIDGDGVRRSAQPASKAWGLPSYLTQGDLLASIAPSLTVRGDTFLIRAYGESASAGVVHARAYLEATVVRGVEYVKASENDALDSSLKIDSRSGTIVRGTLSEDNQIYGRRFRVRSFKWLEQNEI